MRWLHDNNISRTNCPPPATGRRDVTHPSAVFGPPLLPVADAAVFRRIPKPPPWRSALTSLCGRSLLLRRVASPDKYSGRHEGQYCETLSNQIRLEPNHLSFGVYPIRCQVLLSACPFVCLSLGPHVSRTARPSFTKVSVNVRCGRGSVILWRNCFCGWHRVIT